MRPRRKTGHIVGVQRHDRTAGFDCVVLALQHPVIHFHFLKIIIGGIGAEHQCFLFALLHGDITALNNAWRKLGTHSFLRRNFVLCFTVAVILTTAVAVPIVGIARFAHSGSLRGDILQTVRVLFTQNKMQSGILLYAVILQGVSVLQLLPRKNQPLFRRQDSLLVLYFGLHILYPVGRLHLQCDVLPCQCFYEYLHTPCRAAQGSGHTKSQ